MLSGGMIYPGWWTRALSIHEGESLSRTTRCSVDYHASRCGEGFPEAFEERCIQDRGYELPRIVTLGRWVNRARGRGRARLGRSQGVAPGLCSSFSEERTASLATRNDRTPMPRTGVQLAHDRRRRRAQGDDQTSRGSLPTHPSVPAPHTTASVSGRLELPAAGGAPVGGAGHDGSGPEGCPPPTRCWLAANFACSSFNLTRRTPYATRNALRPPEPATVAAARRRRYVGKGSRSAKGATCSCTRLATRPADGRGHPVEG